MHAYKTEYIAQSDEPKDDSDFKKIGLSYEVFAKAVDAGFRAYQREDNDFSTKSAAGYNAWNYVVKELRLKALEHSWGTPFESNGIEGIKSSLRKITIIVNSGNNNTGIKDKEPKPKNQKGSGYNVLMSDNLDLFTSCDDLFDANAITEESADPNQTWLLLFHIDERKEEIRFELLLPTKIENRVISGYKKRIILSPIDISNKPKFTSVKSEEDSTVGIDFDVPRKSG
ncbi:hypothetical protein [Psychrobacter sp. GW64-MNA-CIBAN-0177]|uniref:hypothetical protein n=1 Tax=Psychrobacter sp. GW64-MNA-CIBAN-0177 TaxID=3140449 RepID=UPI0033296CDD